MKRVLIVDDAAFMRLSIKNMLSKYNFEIVGKLQIKDLCVSFMRCNNCL